MKKEKSDIRIRFTKKMIQESLIELMVEKSILKITINEICDRAGVSRSTFYTYYKDQYDLLKQIEQQTFKGLEHIDRKYRAELSKNKNISSKGIEEAVQGFLQYIAENNDSIQVLLSENGDYLFQKRFFNRSIEQLREFREAKGENAADYEMLNCYSLFLVGGFLVLIQDWLKNDMNIPMAKMVKVLASMVHWILNREKFSPNILQLLR